MVELTKHARGLLIASLVISGLFFGTMVTHADSVDSRDEVFVELVRPPIDSVENIKEYEYVIVKDEHGNLTAVVTDDDGEIVLYSLTLSEALELGYIEDITQVPKEWLVLIELWPDGTLVVTVERDDGFRHKQSVTYEELVQLGFIQVGDEVSDYFDPDGYYDGWELAGREPDPAPESDGIPVPKTATSMYNYLAIGVVLAFIGFVALGINQIKKKRGEG